MITIILRNQQKTERLVMMMSTEGLYQMFR